MSGVSKKMQDAISDAYVSELGTYFSNQFSPIDKAELEGLAQDVVNAAWLKFNPDDKSTWPDMNLYQKTYIIMYEDGYFSTAYFYDNVWRGYHNNNRIMNVRAYADLDVFKIDWKLI